MSDSPRTLDFHDHRRSLAENRYVYAVVSRRARGLSIGINLNPDKVCNFDCLYCQVDRTTPGGDARIDLDVLRAELQALLALVTGGHLWEAPPFDTTAPELRRVADLAFAGDGEPTTPPEFPDAARVVREVRDQYGLEVPIRLLTNATMLHRSRVAAALDDIDEVWAKLDAGTEPYYREVDSTGFPFRKVLQNIADLSYKRPVVIQAMFLTLDGEGPPETEIDAWVGRLRHIAARGGNIERVQVYTVARPPMSSRVGALDDAALEVIAARARADGLSVEVHGAA